MGRIRRKLALSIIPTLFLVGFLFVGQVSAESNGGYVAKYVGASVGGQYVNISSVGNVFMEVVPTADGSMSVTKDNIAVETNADTGYRLYISGYNTEANGYTALYKDGNITSSSKIVSIPTSTPTAFSSANINTWGWAVGYNASNGASTGFSADSAYSSLANTGTVTDSSTIASLKWKGISGDYQPISSGSSANEGNPTQTNIYYATYVNKDMPTGNYRNIVVYTAFVEGSNNITVSPNEVADGDTITVETEHQRSPAPITKDQIKVQLYDHTDPSKDLGTCTNIVVDNTYNGTTGNPLRFTCKYNQGSDIQGKKYDIIVEVDALNNGIYISYDKQRVWQLKLNQLADGMEMQDVTPELCANTPLYSVSNKTYVLTDNRDEKQYLVRKLADNKCWMVQNLALEGSKTLDSGNTNLPNGITYTTPDGSSYSGKFNNNNVEHMYNGTHKDAQNDNTSDNTGAYYNWNVATAGYDTAGTLSSGNSNKSICPKGWRLPTSTSAGEFQALYAAYGSNKANMDAAFNLSAYVSIYSSGSLAYSGSRVYWWSSTIISATNAYSLDEHSSGGIYPSSNDSRYYGFSVRCVVAGDGRTLDDISEMQEVTAKICENTPLYDDSHKTYTLTDKRDSKKYLIRKLKDNKCWMVQNLALEGGRTIYGPGVSGHEEDSNLPSGVSYPIPDGTSYASKFGNNKAEHMYNGTHKEAQNDNTSDNTGAYYNWNVATAGYDTSGSLSSGNSNKSICPKGWRLPTSTDSGEFKALYTAYGSNKANMDAAFNLSAYVGNYYSGSLANSGSYVYWWSSTIYSTARAYYLYENSGGGILPSNDNDRCGGFSVRCVAQ